MVRDTLLDFFRDLASARGPFLVYDDGFRSRTHSYEEVGRAAKGFASRLHETGLRKGDKVIFWSENRPEWIVAFWGCLLGGIVVVPIDYRASADFLTRVAGTIGARLILTGQDVPPIASPPAPVWPLADLDWAGGTPPDVTIVRDDVAEIIFTSGATAEPRGVVITHRNVLANIVPVEREVLKYRKWGTPFYPLRFLNLLPLSHMFGQAMGTFVPPMLTGTVVFLRGYNPVDIVDQIHKRRISVLVSVPKILDVLRDYETRLSPETAKPAPPGHKWYRRWWTHRAVHRQFGLKFWAFVVGAAPLDGELEAYWTNLGFVVVQGYGLTETAPIVSLNHPLFGTKQGSVGKAIEGVEVKIAEDGEILVRGENVTTGYFNAPAETAEAFAGGWFHTGDIGEIGPDGRIYIRGRKKEMIVTPEGLNVFPEDVERALLKASGVKDAAVVGVAAGGQERVTAVLVLQPNTDPDGVVREANGQLEEHQKIRRALVWPDATLPRTEGTKKLKRAAIREWARTGTTAPSTSTAGADPLRALLAKYAGRDDLSADTTIDELGLSSLDRVELMVALEDAFQTHIDEGAFAGARDLGQLRELVAKAAETEPARVEPVDFPSWNRAWWARAVRRINLPGWLLPLARLFATIDVRGLEHLNGLDGPVVFAANHQSHMDVPVIMAALPSKWRYRVAPAMAKEFFKPHFFPAQHTSREWFTNSLNYYLAALVFNAFPLPQREAGARQTLRYMGELLADGFSIVIFPEGQRTSSDEIGGFRPGIGMIGSRLDVPIVPVRIRGLYKVLGPSMRMARRGSVSIAFGEPVRLAGEDYDALARRIEEAVRQL